jgi:Na+/melibiose symporter-like transporter
MDLISRDGGFLTLLKKRNFLRLWLAQVISLTVFNASNSALLVLINGITGGSTTQIGLAIICFSLPAVLFGAPAGVVVDHMDKRLVLWGSNCLRALATFLFVLLLFFDRQTLLPFIYLLTFLISTISQFFTPAEGSTIPILVDKDELMPALSLFNITLMLSQALGYVLLAPLALLLLPTFTIGHIAIDANIQLYSAIGIFYLVCAVLILLISPKNFLQKPQPKQQESTGELATEVMYSLNDVWQDMRQGWDFVRRNQALLLAIIQLSFAGVLILVVGELATPIVTKLLLLPAKTMAFVFAPAGVGLVLGSVLMPRITQRLGNSRTIFSGTLGLAAAMTLLPLVTWLVKALQPHGWHSNPLLLLAVALIMCLAGIALDAVNIPALTSIQELTPAWIKGRVLALQLVLYNAASIPIILFLGAITDNFGITTVLYMLSACSLAFGLWGVYYERKYPPQVTDVEHTESEQAKKNDTVEPPSAKLH